MNRQAFTAVACGVMSLLVVHFAYWLNIRAGAALAPEFICNPYIEGCVSTSRAVRSGPGLVWFKAVMLPVALLMMVSWRFVGAWMAGQGDPLPGIRRWTVRLGIGGAIALIFYAVFLGTEGPVYSWLRRYGVVFFFGFTALAQLVAARFVWGAGRASRAAAAIGFVAIVTCQWAIGVFSVLKRFLFSDPDFIDRLENITEWLMIVAMSLGFVLLGLLLRNGGPVRPGSRPPSG